MSVETTILSVEDDPRKVRQSVAVSLLTNTAFLVMMLDLILIVTFALISKNHVFWSAANATALMQNGAQTLILSAGLTLLLGSGVIDLSIGANLVLASTVGAKVVRDLTAVDGVVTPGGHLGAILAGLVAAVLAGAFMGLVNGAVITRLKVDSLIATLGTLGIAQGLALLLTDGSDIYGLPRSLQTGFSLVSIGPVPITILIALAVTCGLWALVRFTRFGLRTLAIGSNITSADRAGIRTGAHITILTIIGGSIAGFAGFLDLARFGGTAQSGHALDGLTAVTAVVIGGTRLGGGRMSFFGTFWGASLSVILINGLIIIGVAPFWQTIVIGVVLIAAVYLDSLRSSIVDDAR